MSRRSAVLACVHDSLVAVVLGIAAAGATDMTPNPAGAAPIGGCPEKPIPISIITVFHSPPNNAFSSVIANGIKQAEADYKCYGVTTQFIGTTNENDVPGAIQLIQAAIVKKPQGLVVTLPDPSAMATVIKQATEAGIPVVAYNGGIAEYRKVGAMSFVGQDEVTAGYAQGQRLIGLGAKAVLCINDAPGNIALDQRCQGIIKAFTEAKLMAKEITGSVTDTSVMDGAIRGALQADPNVDAAGGSYCGSPEPGIVYKAFKDAGKADGSFHIGIFDLSDTCMQMIKSGKLDFASSQAQFLQGYLPVAMLALWNRFGLLPGAGAPVLTGPTFVDKSNIDQFAQHIKEKTF
jgi:simple sugar transport system substrate-binding protein